MTTLSDPTIASAGNRAGDLSIERHAVYLALPGSSFGFGTVRGIIESSLGLHDVIPDNSGNGFDDFNVLWAAALNAYEAGNITHFAMLHSDIAPDPGWLDLLLAEMDRLDADLISAAVPLKDRRGLTSCGVGDPLKPFEVHRRFTLRELAEMPETFGIVDTPHPRMILLHNSGCFVCDLRSPLFRATNADGSLKCLFDFPTRIVRRPDGKWENQRESEDWFFSRKIHELGARSFITRKVKLSHVGRAGFPNSTIWGSYLNGDDETRDRWAKGD